MGILIDALAIAGGSLFGSRFQKKHTGNYHTLGIGIMIVSIVGFLENIYSIKDRSIVSTHLIVVLFAYLFGSKIGELLHLDERLNHLSRTSSQSFNTFLDSSLFFGVGGLQISGPVLLALTGDSSQLFLKSFVDLPFAVSFGAAFGKSAALSALPVAFLQLLIAAVTHFFSAAVGPTMTGQICAMGYIILFFSGFNLVSDSKHKISNINMLPGFFIIILLHLASSATEGL